MVALTVQAEEQICAILVNQTFQPFPELILFDRPKPSRRRRPLGSSLGPLVPRACYASPLPGLGSLTIHQAELWLPIAFSGYAVNPR